ncbi:MAG: hypothetical protein ABII82_13265, partial [Verrucomicrobiota bacterium]
MIPTWNEFLAQVKYHALTVEHDDGLYRHWRCQKPGTTIDGFDIVTWPGYLTISGDMGCYVFARQPSMIGFHRREGDGEPKISFYYWAEKLQAVDKTDGLEKFSPEKFAKAVRDYVSEESTGEPPGEDLLEAAEDIALRAD